MVNLKISRSALASLIVFTFGGGCSTTWTDKERNEFAANCAQTKTANNLTFRLTGFSYEEVENIIVRHIHDGRVVDSFYVQPNKNAYDSLRTSVTTSIDRTLHITDTYQFVIPGQQTFVLSDMKMIMWARYAMLSEGWGCVMGDYKIDGKRFEHDMNPDFVKKGFKLP